MKHCLIGSNGFISKRHRQAIKNIGGELALTCDINGQADFNDWVEMIHSPKFEEIDMVSICTPNYLHSVMIKEILALNKDVLCEKPLTIFNDINDDNPNLGVVLQLRYNPLIIGLKEKDFKGNIKIVVKTYRPPEYWNSWKGDPLRSGGILYNMGIHYLDLLIHLLGDPVFVIESKYTRKLATGIIEFERGTGEYHIELLDDEQFKDLPVIRRIFFNGIETNLEGATIPLDKSDTVIDLHTEVYKNFIAGNGIGLDEAKKSLNLIKLLI